MFPIKNCKPNNRDARKHDVIKLIKNVIVNGGATEETNPAKHPNWDNIEHIFVEHVGDQVGIATICFTTVTK